MKPFLDLTGASGAAYRFRRLEHPSDLPAMAGNFVALVSDTAAVVCCGTARSLLEAAGAWAQAEKKHGADAFYIRLNVARQVREDEYADLVAAVKPPMKVVGPS